MQLVEETTGLDSTKQIAVGAITLGLLYIGSKILRSQIPSEKSCSKSLNVLIIGASRGIGLSLAQQFLTYGDNVIIASSSQNSIEKAYNNLVSTLDLSSTSQILERKKCDVVKPQDLQSLFDFAFKTFNGNKIDIIINNFGIDSDQRDYLWNVSCDDIQRIVNVNLGGMLLSNKLSIESFIKSGQETPLHIFNMSGAGTDGMKTPRFVSYGATKGGFLNIMNSVNKELKLAGMNKKVFMHSLSPGMVWTNLLANKQNIDNNKPVVSDPKSYWIMNALTEDVEIVTGWMVPKIRGVVCMKKSKAGFQVNFLTKYSAFGRILRGAFFGYNKEKYINKKGLAVQDTK